MFPPARTRIGKIEWRVILEDKDKVRRVVVVSAGSKTAAVKQARALWTAGCYVYDTSVVSAFDPNWFDVPWSEDSETA